jgi:undecaprenyl-diphosphatase
MDQALFHLINERWTHPVLDLFMAAISNVEIWKPFMVLLGLGILVWGRFRGRAFLICVLFSFLIAEQVTSALKTVVDRRRPKQTQTVRMVELQRTRPEFFTLFKQPRIRYSDRSDKNRSGPSFPSGHTTDNTVIAVCCTAFFRRGWLYWIVAAAISYSRIYLGAHWPSDVIGTAFLAAGETLLILAALEGLWRVMAPRRFPGTYSDHPSLIFDRHQANAALAHRASRPAVSSSK